MKKILNWKKMMGAALVAASLIAVGTMQDKAEAATLTVQHGQTLSLLAKQSGTTVQAIQYTNNLASDLIVTGQKLNMPFVYKASKNDTLWYVAKRYHTSVDDIMIVNSLKPGTMLKAGQNIVIPVGHVKHPAKKTAVATKVAAHKAVAPAASKTTAPAPKAVSAPAAAKTTAPAPRATAPATQSVAGHAYKSITSMVATAYGPADETGPWGGLTYMGTKTRFGEIAVDPSVIPLGTKVFITGYNSPLLPAGGFYATAEDIGGKIKGNRIDIYINGSEASLQNFGMQNVKMYILK